MLALLILAAFSFIAAPDVASPCDALELDLCFNPQQALLGAINSLIS